MASLEAIWRRLAPPNTFLMWFGLIALGVVLTAWTMLTPEGILGKADAVGYAVCHRIPERSFTLPDGRPVAMCARCTGTFLGVMIGLFVPGLVFRRRRAGNFPPIWMLIVLFGFSAWWAFDGANSFAHLLPTSPVIPRLFPPNNFLRVTTGTLHGLTMGSVILPVVNATLWADATDERTMDKPWHLLALVGMGTATIALVYSELPVFLYPASVLSAVGVVVILGAIASVVVATVLGIHNQALTIGDALPILIMGLVLVMMFVGLVDALRFSLFGTWDGFIITP